MNQLAPLIAGRIPAIIASRGEKAAYRFLEFFTAAVRNPHTRRAYAASGDGARVRQGPASRVKARLDTSLHRQRSKISAPTVVAVIASEAKQSRAAGLRPLDGFVASPLAMTVVGHLERFCNFSASP